MGGAEGDGCGGVGTGVRSLPGFSRLCARLGEAREHSRHYPALLVQSEERRNAENLSETGLVLFRSAGGDLAGEFAADVGSSASSQLLLGLALVVYCWKVAAVVGLMRWWRKPRPEDRGAFGMSPALRDGGNGNVRPDMTVWPLVRLTRVTGVPETQTAA